MNGLLTVLTVVVVGLVVPLGVRLLWLPAATPVSWWLGAGAAAALGSLWESGPIAMALVLPWCALGGFAAATGLGRLRELRAEPARALAALTASTSLAVAAFALVVDRSGTAPFLGFESAVWRLTVLHFCVAGFAAALLAGLALVATGSRAAAVGCVTVPTGTALVAAGHFLGDHAELAGALVLTVGLLASSFTVLRRVVHLDDSGGQLLAVSAAVTPVTMTLAVWWAFGESFDVPHLSLTQTAATHGVGNAFGIGLCGVLGWSTVAKEQL